MDHQKLYSDKTKMQGVTRAAANKIAKKGRAIDDNRSLVRKQNKTGLPGKLRSGIEDLSGYSMEDVRVHYNSPKPAQINAHAYAQGSDIHIATGQKKYLPHEAWHVVQQKQKKVTGTVHEKGITINDDISLEKEADSMGAKAGNVSQTGVPRLLAHKRSSESGVVQGMFIMSDRGSDLREYLKFKGVENAKAWFEADVKPRLVGIRLSALSFEGWLNHQSDDYRISITLQWNQELSDAAHAVASALIAHKLSDKKKKGIGVIKVVERGNFGNLVTAAFSKAEVMQSTKLPSREVHLRHFVMGSWFRALPDLVLNHTDYDPDKKNNRDHACGRINKQVMLISPSVKGMAISTGSDLESAINMLADLLHDLPHNLNLGEGSENSIIGLASHAFSNIAFMIKNESLALSQDAVMDTVKSVLGKVGFVTEAQKEEYIRQHLPGIVGSLSLFDPVPPADGFEFFTDIAYSLGMDFMKHDQGRAVQLQAGSSKADILELQSKLIPVGDQLKSCIMSANWRKLHLTDLEKLLNKIDEVAKFVATHPITK